MFQFILTWLRSLFFAKSLECCIVGLQASGKTSITNVLTNGQFSEEMVPTVGFSLRKVTKGNVTMKLFDVAGQSRFRSIWPRYCIGVNAILFVVDSSDSSSFASAAVELHALIEQPQLSGIPILVLGNKSDIEGHASVAEIIQSLDLSSIKDREVSVYSVSAKNSRNIDLTLGWLMKRV